MRVIICDTPEDAVAFAVGEVVGVLRHKPHATLGLATGGTMEPFYAALASRCQSEILTLSGVTTFNLDEYVGIPREHPASYRYYMQRHFFDHVSISPERIHLPDGMAENLEAECEQYERAIDAAGGIDLQLLGIGGDGHIGFNEPGSSLASRTRVKTLAQRTLRDNARFFERPEDVPRIAITMGVGTILAARQILLLAVGQGKATAVAAGIEGPITAAVTASALQLHAEVIAVLDRAAAADLRFGGYYQTSESMRAELLRNRK